MKDGDISINDIKVFSSIKELLSEYSDADSVIIDIPIGLPESKEDLRPDSELRKRLKGKASSVFTTPCRQAVYANDYEKASKINREEMGIGLSKQSFETCKKIKEVDEFLHSSPYWQEKLKESHPEYGFAVLNNDNPVLESKTSYFGAVARISILKRYLFNINELIEDISRNTVLKNRLDDVLDAICLAVVGDFGVNTEFHSIPEKPEKDKKGLLMQIVYAEVNKCLVR